MEYRCYGDNRWKIVCGSYDGVQKNATDLLYAGVRKEVPYVLVAETAQAEINVTVDNLLLIGTRADNPLLAQCITEEDIPTGGYLVKVMPSPFASTRQVAVIAGSLAVHTLYAAAHFVGVYLPIARRHATHTPYFSQLFSDRMPEYETAQAPAFAERGIWTWGHCIYDYRRFAQNMARLGLNAITIWNDFAPLNLHEVVECFHSYGIKVIFGYSWGWDEGVDIASEQELARWTQRALEVYERDYARAGGDGIYIQSFTETHEEVINGCCIAESVVHWVNTIGDAMLRRWPGLELQFGLHATSVRVHLDKIAEIDSRIRILWEDCGAFPYDYLAREVSTEIETLAFTDTIVALRPGADCGVVLKGQVCLDWSLFEHQKSSFIMGHTDRDEIERRTQAIRAQWHDVQSYWLQNIGSCRRTLEHLKGSAVYALVEDALFEEVCWYPTALYAQLLWTPQMSEQELLQCVAQRADVTLA